MEAETAFEHFQHADWGDEKGHALFLQGDPGRDIRSSADMRSRGGSKGACQEASDLMIDPGDSRRGRRGKYAWEREAETVH